MVAGKVLVAVTVCMAVGLLIYLTLHSDEYSGIKPGPLPGTERPITEIIRPTERDHAPDPMFSER
jgi:hypothetical protein